MSENMSEAAGTARGAAETARQSYAQAKEAARQAYDQVRERATTYYQQGKEKAADYTDQLEETVKAQPIKSVLIAAGIGVLVGMILRRM